MKKVKNWKKNSDLQKLFDIQFCINVPEKSVRPEVLI